MGRGFSASRTSKIRVLLLHSHFPAQVLPKVEISGKNKHFRVRQTYLGHLLTSWLRLTYLASVFSSM